MTIDQAKEILLTYRPWTADVNDTSFAEALALVRQNEELRRWFEAHCAAQQVLHERFRKIPVPAGLKEQIISEQPASVKLVWLRQPALLAVAAALVLLGSLAGFWFYGTPAPREEINLAGFRGRMVSGVLRGYEMELATSDLTQIHTFLVAHTNGDYVLPAGLSKATATGCAARNTWQGHPVALICFRTGKPLPPGQSNDLWLFVIDRRSLPDAPKGNQPQFTKENRLMTVSWSAGDKTYVLATEGDKELLRSFL